MLDDVHFADGARAEGVHKAGYELGARQLWGVWGHHDKGAAGLQVRADGGHQWLYRLCLVQLFAEAAERGPWGEDRRER